MKRVVVTGLGIVSSIGCTADEVAASLKAGTSGIRFSEEQAKYGFKSQVSAEPALNPDDAADKRNGRFMGPGAAWAYAAMGQAIIDSGLTADEVSNPRTGLIIGSGGPSTRAVVAAADIAREKGPRRVGPFAVPKCMSSTCSATLATAYEIKGLSYSISSACATSSHCIMDAADQIKLGRHDIMFAGGGEELDWTLSVLFDAMGAMSSAYNLSDPTRASRPFDANRDGFVIAGGAGVLVLEDYDRAKARGAKIYAEITGYGATSDGHDMVAPSGEGAARCMKQALEGITAPIDYLNPHATSTPVGDIKEAEALRAVFGAHIPALSATKALTGHSLGAAGVQEAIYSLLMMRDGFIAGSAHIDTIDPALADLPIVRESRDAILNTVLSNSFGFGGTNASLVFSRV